MLEVESFALNVVLGIADEDDFAGEVVLQDSVGAGGTDWPQPMMEMRVWREDMAHPFVVEWKLLSQFNFGGALAALVLRWFGDGGDVGMAAEVFAQGAAEDAHASAVDDADAREAGEEGAVEEAFDFGLGFVGGAADDVDLGGHVVGVVVGGGDGDASAFASGFERGDDFDGLDFGDVVDGGAHLHWAHGDFEGLCGSMMRSTRA